MPLTVSPPDALHWSHTRAETLAMCRRRYFYRYVLARGGWRRSASERARRAYVLAHLTTFEQVLGLAVHRISASIVRRILAQRSIPPLDAIRDALRWALNKVYQNGRDRAQFERDPRGHPVLLESYYDRAVDTTRIGRIAEKLERCATNLTTTSVWEDLSSSREGTVQLFDRPVDFEWAGATVWAAPDLVYEPGHGPPVLLDWKTGLVSVDAAVGQLSVYAGFAAEKLKLPIPEGGYEGQIADLQRGEVWSVSLDEAAVEGAGSRVAESVHLMAQLAGAPESDTETWERTPHRHACYRCPFLELCNPTGVLG